MTFLTSARVTCLLAGLALAPAATAAEIDVSDAYVRMTPPGARVSAAFMVIANPTGAARKLVRAESPAAKVVELHAHLLHDGIMQMRKVDSIEIAAGARVELKPGGYHVMLIDIKSGGREHEPVPITLFFDDGSSKRVAAALRRDAGAAPSGAKH